MVGVVTFGAVTAFAATLNVSSKSLSAGNASVSTCNAAANVTYTTSYSSSLPGYIVATAPITTAGTCSGMSFKVTLTGASGQLGTDVPGTLDGTGAGTATFTSQGISAALVTGVSVVITG